MAKPIFISTELRIPGAPYGGTGGSKYYSHQTAANIGEAYVKTVKKQSK